MVDNQIVFAIVFATMCRCHNPSLGLATKAKACKVAIQEGNMGIIFHAPGSAKECEGMNPHTSKWTPMLGIEVPNGFLNF
jgi:hypothetical protein